MLGTEFREQHVRLSAWREPVLIYTSLQLIDAIEDATAFDEQLPIGAIDHHRGGDLAPKRPATAS